MKRYLMSSATSLGLYGVLLATMIAPVGSAFASEFGSETSVQEAKTSKVSMMIHETEQEVSRQLINEILGNKLVPDVVSQPDLPMELRPRGVPIVRPSARLKQSTQNERLTLLAPAPVAFPQKRPDGPPVLLREPEADPNIVYVVPFTGVMVPKDIFENIFDQFVDTMNQKAAPFGLQFVILKQGKEAAGADWLSARKYIIGEVYSYVEDTSCCSTEIRTKVHISFFRPHQAMPDVDYNLPMTTFFDHDHSTLKTERKKLADNIVVDLTGQLLPKLSRPLVSSREPGATDSGT